MSIELNALTRSAKARELGIDNAPPTPALVLFEDFKEKVLRPLCDRHGNVYITSGYRCPELNTAIGGAATSDHVWDAFGIACDFTVTGKDLKTIYDELRGPEGLSIPFDQLILEHEKGTEPPLYRCIHISYRPNPRRMAMRGGTYGSTKYEHDTVAGLEDA